MSLGLPRVVDYILTKAQDFSVTFDLYRETDSSYDLKFVSAIKAVMGETIS
jgi:hypothetical protein